MRMALFDFLTKEGNVGSLSSLPAGEGMPPMREVEVDERIATRFSLLLPEYKNQGLRKADVLVAGQCVEEPNSLLV
jgi:hypothetical protein